VEALELGPDRSGVLEPLGLPGPGVQWATGWSVMSQGMGLLETGVLLDGRYEVLRLLGQGGMAAVYQVRHLGLHSVHALKVLNADLAQNDEVRGRFLTEGRIQARLRHPHIVQVTEIVTTPVAGLVMDYVEGPTLGDFCRSGERPGLEPAVLLEVFLPVLEAMGEAHQQGVVHRDLKPDNILIGRDSRGRLQPRVTDFGIAKVLEQQEGSGKGKTRAGTRMGTLLYMSPEQIRSTSEVDARSDIFALGAILYEAATGQLAFDGRSDFETMSKIVEGDFQPPERAVGHLPPVIAGCIRKALAVDPAERFQSCGEFRAVLERALEANAPVPVKPGRSFAVTKIDAVPVVSEAAPEAATPAPVDPSAPSALVRAPPSAPVPTSPVKRAQTGSTPRPVPPGAPPPGSPHGFRSPLPRRQGTIPPSPQASPALALVLSVFCLPGAGQIYNGQVLKGLGIIGLSIASVAATSGVACLAIPAVYILSAMDAYQIASKRQRGQWVDTWEFF
jgi:eukaryotic-like serine/threonine-protein kinase